MNIIFFGASVTEQRKLGYVGEFKKLVKEINYRSTLLNYNVIQEGYGSMQLGNAGICMIDKIILQKPNICFIDWFTPCKTYTYNDLCIYLDVIVRKLMLINCQIVFLLFDSNPLYSTKLSMYNDVIKYSNEYNLNYIKLYGNSNVTELLRDSVHTTPIGDKFYANKIYEFFMNNNLNNSNIITYEKIPLANKFSNISSIDLNKIVNHIIILKGNFEIIGISQKIGKFSGLINITRNNTISYNTSIWDVYCNFERNTMKIFIDLSQIVKIKILQDNFDTSLCKDKDIKFEDYTKYLDIKKIYYIGDLYIDLIDDISQNINEIKNNNIIQNKSRKIKLFKKKLN
jgi:hypothetical protein